jgi:hypothetical protein
MRARPSGVECDFDARLPLKAFRMDFVSLALATALLISPAASVTEPEQNTPVSQSKASPTASQWISSDASDEVCFRHHTVGSNVVTVECHNPDDVVCIKHERTGTRIVTNECHQRQVWDQMTQEGQQDTEDVQRRSNFLMGMGH